MTPSPTAIHEAGHATVARLAGAKVHELVLHDRKHGFTGYCRHDEADSLMAAAAICLAGEAAETRATGRCVFHADHTDRQSALKLFGNRRDCAGMLFKAEVAASKLVAENWDAIEALAGELEARRTMTGREVEAVLSRFDDRDPLGE